MKGGLHNHLDFGLLEYAGIKCFWENRENKRAMHFEIPPDINVAFIEIPKNYSSGKRFDYFFGNFRGSLYDSEEYNTKRLLLELDKIAFFTLKRKANELNSFIVSTLCKEGLGKLVVNYYKELWSIS